MQPELTLTTERLVLRPISVTDTEEAFPYMSDPEISRYMSWQPHKELEETRSLLQRLEAETNSGQTYSWAIVHEGRFCGLISVISILRTHRALRYDKGELAYWLGREFRGRGLMTEAASAVVEFSFAKLGLHRLTVSHVTENHASEALIRRLRFSYIGTERQAFQKDGKWFDHRLYDLLASDHGSRAYGISRD